MLNSDRVIQVLQEVLVFDRAERLMDRELATVLNVPTVAARMADSIVFVSLLHLLFDNWLLTMGDSNTFLTVGAFM